MAVFKSVFILSTFLVSLVIAGKHDIYSGYTVHGVKLTSQSHMQLLHDLEISLDVDVWEHGAVGLRDALVMVSPQNKEQFLEELEKNDAEHYLHLEDVAKAFEEHDDVVSRFQQSRTNRMVFDSYPRYAQVSIQSHEICIILSDSIASKFNFYGKGLTRSPLQSYVSERQLLINAYLERIAEEYPDIVTLVEAGTSWEGRAIKYLKISTTNFTDTSKPIYYMDAMIHAREWVTTPVALYSIHRLVEDLREQDRDLLENIDWIIHPLVNPDGYEYTHTDVRLWRRTRSYWPEVSETCYGIDANRNFNVSFNTVGVSSNPCSDTYPGQEPFSEPESQIVRDIIEEHLDRMQLYMNIHSHGNWVLYGFGSGTLPSNVAQIHLVGATMGAAMDAVKLPEAGYYLVGNSALILYATSGSAQDYGQYVGVPFSYTLELPGYGRNFVVPPQYIDHINEETWRGIAASARLARSYYVARNAN